MFKNVIVSVDERQDGRDAIELLARARAESHVEAGLLPTGSPSVGRGLHELAELHRADLLVVGSTSRGLIGRVLIGDDTRDALNGAPCAVAVAPSGYAKRPAALSEIGVAYNRSPESEHALEPHAAYGNAPEELALSGDSCTEASRNSWRARHAARCSC